MNGTMNGLNNRNVHQLHLNAHALPLIQLLSFGISVSLSATVNGILISFTLAVPALWIPLAHSGQPIRTERGCQINDNRKKCGKKEESLI